MADNGETKRPFSWAASLPAADQERFETELTETMTTGVPVDDLFDA